MARIRTVKPEFWTDAKIISVSPLARLLLVGMFNFADDEGRMDYSPIQMKARIFPADETPSIKEIIGLLGELKHSNLINVYSCEKNHSYIEIKNFRKHQKIDRPNPSIIPAPSRELVELSAKGSEESPPEGNGREGNGREGYIVSPNGDTRDILPNVTPPVPDKEAKANAKTKADFEIWWKAFPTRRKIGKPKCYQKWLQLRRDKKLLPLSEMLTILERQKRSKDWTKDGGDFTPGPHPYLNQFMFLDESAGTTPSTVPSHQPAEEVVTPENVHKFANPTCPECQGKGMFIRERGEIKMRVRCDCVDLKRKGETK